MSASASPQSLIDDLVRSTQASDPFEAIRLKAKDAIARYTSVLGEPEMPLNIDAVASLLGITKSEELPAFSEDAELVPEAGGRVSIRVNPDRPETRIRFSIGHEVSHTFFPNYQVKSWCRTDARYRRRDNPDDLIEMLCDVGAAELLLPAPWFVEDAKLVASAAGLIELAKKYSVSTEATLRRFAETHSDCLAAVFFSWKLKPTQKRSLGRSDQPSFLDLNPAEEGRLARQLRLDYCIPSREFSKRGLFLPKDKSVKNEGPLFQAASTHEGCEGECWLDLGQAAGEYSVMAIPLWTAQGELGPRGEIAVAAIIRPKKRLSSTRPKPATSIFG